MKKILADQNIQLGNVIFGFIGKHTTITNAIGTLPETFALVRQVHSAICLDTTDATDNSSIEADAHVTATPGVFLGIKTADCVPVLFVDEKNALVAAAHAGWRGAISGILEATIESLLQHGADIETTQVIIGPCIHQKSYEVGQEFYDTFLSHNKKNAKFFIPSSKTGHFKFDLPGYIEQKLKNLGFSKIHNIQIDTLADENWFSHRRATLVGNPQNEGRILSFIGITPAT